MSSFAATTCVLCVRLQSQPLLYCLITIDPEVRKRWFSEPAQTQGGSWSCLLAAPGTFAACSRRGKRRLNCRHTTDPLRNGVTGGKMELGWPFNRADNALSFGGNLNFQLIFFRVKGKAGGDVDHLKRVRRERQHGKKMRTTGGSLNGGRRCTMGAAAQVRGPERWAGSSSRSRCIQ